MDENATNVAGKQVSSLSDSRIFWYSSHTDERSDIRYPDYRTGTHFLHTPYTLTRYFLDHVPFPFYSIPKKETTRGREKNIDSLFSEN